MFSISGRSQFVAANGLRHHILAYGGAGGVPLIILPGITSPAPAADFLAARIAEMGFAVFVPDFRGRGKTDTPPSGHYRLADYAADVAAIAAALGLERPVLIGHSMGARVAAAYVAKFASANHALTVLVDPPLSGPGRDPYPTSLASFMAQLSEAKAGTTVEQIRRFYPKWSERELRIRLEALPGCDETAVRESHESFENEDFLHYWEALTLPAALIYGAASPVVTAAGAAELAQRNPAIDIFKVPEAGHMVPWDNEKGFFDVLTPILAKTKR